MDGNKTVVTKIVDVLLSSVCGNLLAKDPVEVSVIENGHQGQVFVWPFFRPHHVQIAFAVTRFESLAPKVLLKDL